VEWPQSPPLSPQPGPLRRIAEGPDGEEGGSEGEGGDGAGGAAGERRSGGEGAGTSAAHAEGSLASPPGRVAADRKRRKQKLVSFVGMPYDHASPGGGGGWDGGGWVGGGGGDGLERHLARVSVDDLNAATEAESSLPPGVPPEAVTWPPPPGARGSDDNDDDGDGMLPQHLEDLACSAILSLRSPAFIVHGAGGGGGDIESGASSTNFTVVRAQMELKVRLVLRAAASRTAVVLVGPGRA